MALSFEKTKAMVILSNAKELRLAVDEIDLNLNLDVTQIQNTKQEKLLGVIIDNNLTWHNQIKKSKTSNCFQAAYTHIEK